MCVHTDFLYWLRSETSETEMLWLCENVVTNHHPISSFQSLEKSKADCQWDGVFSCWNTHWATMKLMLAWWFQTFKTHKVYTSHWINHLYLSAGPVIEEAREECFFFSFICNWKEYKPRSSGYEGIWRQYFFIVDNWISMHINLWSENESLRNCFVLVWLSAQIC